MLYLLTLGWPWFAAACALGALVGYLTTSRVKDAPVAAGWVIVAAALALGAGGMASAFGLFEGRDAVALDIALLASVAYLVGLPIGGALKAMSLSAPAQETKRPVVVLRGASTQAPRPIIAPPQPEAPIVAAPEEETRAEQPALDATVLAAKALNEKAAHMRAPTSVKAPPGARPAMLASPRGDAADDLSKIKGLGPKSVDRLHALGVFHYDQIAAWSADNVKWIEASIGAVGRVKRNEWVEQARALSGSADAPRKADAA